MGYVHFTRSGSTMQLGMYGTKPVFAIKEGQDTRDEMNPYRYLEVIFSAVYGLLSNHKLLSKPMTPRLGSHILSRSYSAVLMQSISIYERMLRAFLMSFTICGSFGARPLVLITIVSVGEARSTQCQIFKRDETHIPINLSSLLPCWITFQCILWRTVITHQSRVSQIVLLAFELFVVLTLLPALREIGIGGLVLGIGFLLLLGSKFLVPVDGHHTLSDIPPTIMIKRCMHCNRTDCGGNCGQGGSSGGNDNIL